MKWSIGAANTLWLRRLNARLQNKVKRASGYRLTTNKLKGMSMKKSVLLVTTVAAFVFAATASRTFADDREVTITGEGKCAKCALKETKECQNVIQVTKEGRMETYYLAKNDVSKKFHENLCQDSKKVKATGKVKEVEGKKELTVSKIELAE
jgi:hypothetical protein